jgi:hypothetical protein
MKRDLRKYFVLGSLPMVATIGGGILFKDFVVNAIETNLALNMKIVITMCIGAALMYWRMWQMWVEDKALRKFARLAHAKGTEDPSIVTKRMRAVIDSKEFAKRDIRKVLEPVAQTGGRIRSRVDQAAIEGEIHSMKAELEARWEFPNFLVGFMVALGLLGTFIGLLETLVGTSALIGNFGTGGNLDEAIGALVTGLQKPLAGMGTAFSASMFGLVGSCVLGMIMMSVRAFGNGLVGNVHGTVTDFTERIGPVNTGVSGAGVSEGFLANAMADMLDVQREAQETFNRSLQSTVTVAARTEGVLGKLDSLAQAVAAQTSAITRSNDLAGVGPRMREIAELNLAESKALVGGMTGQIRAVESLQAAIIALERRISAQVDGASREREVLRAHLASVSESQDATRKMLGSMLDAQREQQVLHSSEMQSLRQTTIDSQAAMAGWASRLGHLQQIAGDQLVLSERQGAGIEQMTAALMGMTTQISAGIEQQARDQSASRTAQIDVAKQLSGLGTVLRLNNEQVVEHMTKLAESTQQHSAMAGMVGQEIRALKGGIGREVRKELREAVGQINAASSGAAQDD